MNAPQITMAVLTLVGLLLAAKSHGTVRFRRESFWITLFAATVQQAILYWGGFWS